MEQTAATAQAPRLQVLDVVVWSLGFLSIIFSVYAVHIGWHNSIFDYYGFRQAQTAISADSILHGGPILRYETPVVGPPWSIPFEFPLYQAIVATVARLTSAPLDEAGRLVSVVFFYLCFIPLASILSAIGWRGIRIVPALALLAASPLYIFCSRMFMIESTALFFSLTYAALMLRLLFERNKFSYAIMGLAALSGVLAALVKVTTFAPCLLFGASLFAYRLWQDRKAGTLALGVATPIAFCCGALPVAAAWMWTHFADSVKSLNPIGNARLTSKVLSQWNYGTFAQRIDPANWLVIVHRMSNVTGSTWVLLLTLLVALWLCRRSVLAVAVGVGIALFVVTISIFFNLYVIHDYYLYASGIFMLIALGLALGALIDLPGRRAWIGVALLATQLGFCAVRYRTGYYLLQHTNAPGRPQAAALIDRTTKPDSVLFVLGMGWSSEFPYQSHRRALTTAWPDIGVPQIEQSIANQGPQNIAALVACEHGREDPMLPSYLRELAIDSSAPQHADDCDVYERIPATR